MSEPFLGEIRIVGFTFPPRNWADCDGQLLSISQNTALFSLLGTMHHGACLIAEDFFEPGKTLDLLEREQQDRLRRVLDRLD